MCIHGLLSGLTISRRLLLSTSFVGQSYVLIHTLFIFEKAFHTRWARTLYRTSQAHAAPFLQPHSLSATPRKNTAHIVSCLSCCLLAQHTRGYKEPVKGTHGLKGLCGSFRCHLCCLMVVTSFSAAEAAGRRAASMNRPALEGAQ